MKTIKITRNELATLNIIIGNLNGFNPEPVEWVDGVMYARRVTFDPKTETVADFIRDAARDADNGEWLAACREIIRCGKVISA